ncbi:hypothetical protein [Eoetvoesiella caeni]
MKSKIEEPITMTTEGGEKYVTTHPSFAQISASRISGQTHLYGSDFAHQSYVRVRINPSKLHRSLSNDWAFADSNSYLVVDMSEAQWASFVSSMNVGSGTQCTLRTNNGEQIAELPAPPSRTDQFSKEMGLRVERALDAVAQLANDVNDLKVSEKTKATLLARISKAHRELVSNTKFVADQFEEHMEVTVEKAKVEVNAYAINTLMQAGLEAVRKPVIEYSGEGTKALIKEG